jgi:hypothetical protein
VQSYDLLEILSPDFEEDHHNFACIETQAESLNQTCISSKSIMQLTKTIFPDSASFIEKKRVENRLWRKVNFCGEKNSIICLSGASLSVVASSCMQ